MTIKVTNPAAHNLAPHRKSFTISVQAVTDGFEGAWNDPIDLMNWIAGHSYVQSVELVETPSK